MYKKLLLFIHLLFFATYGFSQNLEEIKAEKGVKLNGAVTLNTVGYLSEGIRARRDPFAWFLSGSLNVNLFGYNAPLSFSYSNTQRKFTQPFNQFSFAPQYKWVRAYIGYNSMTFSNYTLAGHVFFGGGVELTPGKWRVAAMFGRLRKAVPYDLNAPETSYSASFKRMGAGLKVGYDDGGGNSVGLMFFGAKDIRNSLPFIISYGPLTPKENGVVGITGRKKIIGGLFVDGEYAISAINSDTRAASTDSLNLNSVDLVPERTTTRYFSAYNASVGYQREKYSIQLRYERIAPEYQTLGAYYFNNDMRNITIVPSVRLFNSTLTLNGNVGFQRNNLDKSRESTTQRFVGSVNANYLPNEKWNFSGSYSNFTTFTNIRPQPDPFFRNNLDTLNFYQLNNTINGLVGYNFGSQERKQNVMLNVSYQRAKDAAEFASASEGISDFYTTNLSHSYTIVPKSLTVGTSVNYYIANTPGVQTNYYGPNLSLSKQLFERTVRATLSNSYNYSKANERKNGAVFNTRFNVNYSPKKKETQNKMFQQGHVLGISINVLNKLDGEVTKGYSEYTGSVVYTYSF
ncbi:MAG TPA: hypothetical protein VF691_12265 [Cytophagaceae bacterium]|jgi:hypothetical protein